MKRTAEKTQRKTAIETFKLRATRTSTTHAHRKRKERRGAERTSSSPSMGEMGGLNLHQTGPGTSVGSWLWLEDWNHVRSVPAVPDQKGRMQDEVTGLWL